MYQQQHYFMSSTIPIIQDNNQYCFMTMIKEEQQQELLLTSGYYPSMTNVPLAATGSDSNNLSSPDMVSYPYYTDMSYLSPSSSCASAITTFSPCLESFSSVESFDFYPTLDWNPSLQQQQPALLLPTTTTKSSINKKQPTTTENRPYSCHSCPRSFARKHDLHRHIRVHTGDKPYSCLNCKKNFARTDALKRHFRMEESCRTSPIIMQEESASHNKKRRCRKL